MFTPCFPRPSCHSRGCSRPTAAEQGPEPCPEPLVRAGATELWGLQVLSFLKDSFFLGKTRPHKPADGVALPRSLGLLPSMERRPLSSGGA